MSPEPAPSPGGPGASGLLVDDPQSFEILGSETVFRGHIWDVKQERFDYNGHVLERDFIAHPGAVAILAMDDEGQVLLIKQYRHPVRHREWEIPAGLLDVAGEAPLRAAQRELAEEADLVAAQWNVLGEFYTSPGGSDEAIRIYLARGLNPTRLPFAREAEEADLETRWVPLDEVVDGVLARRLQSPSLVVATLTASAARARGWASLGAADEPWSRHPPVSR